MNLRPIQLFPSSQLGSGPDHYDMVRRGIADIEAVRTYGADAAIAQLQQRRAKVSKSAVTGKTAKKRG